MFRFTIRDVLWLTVVVAVGFGAFLSSPHWSCRFRVGKHEATGQDMLTDTKENRSWRRLGNDWVATN